MEILSYPIDCVDGGTRNLLDEFIKGELKKNPILLKKVDAFLKRVQESKSLQPFFDSKLIDSLEQVKINNGKATTKLYEMRIPPERRGGVVRLYFIMQGDKILIIDGEIKKRTKSKIIDSVKKKINSITIFEMEKYHGN